MGVLHVGRAKTEVERRARRAVAKRRYKDAHAAQIKEYEAGRREAKLAQNRAWRLRAEFGITPEQYDTILAAQNGQCAVCEKAPGVGERKLAVDHDHATGAVRGLLCFRCNASIGKFGDDPALLDKAAAYLRTPRASEI